jgi:hypothetical protein
LDLDRWREVGFMGSRHRGWFDCTGERVILE